jgi:hypothetical protein
MTPTRSSAGSAPRTLPQPKAKRSAVVKSSPTGPRAARREAVPLDGRAQRSYPNDPRPYRHLPGIRLIKVGRSIKESETRHDGAAELVFQVISERNERASMICTTNLPFGEWTKVFPDPRLAKAVVDRITHKAHIIDTGTESWRFRHGLERQRGKRA